MVTRRDVLLGGGGVAAAGAVLLGGRGADAGAAPYSAGNGTVQSVGVTVPNGTVARFVERGGVKIFRLVAQEFEQEMVPGLRARLWGYNGASPGPVIEVYEGDTIRVYVTNRLPEPTSMHWHGIFLPNGMDGVAGLTQPAIAPGETFKYEFTLRQHGTFMYHPHYDEMTQMGLGMQGMFIVHPQKPREPSVDRDFVMMLSEWRIPPGASRPDPNAMSEFNLLTINGHAFPGTEPLVVRQGQRVRLRVGNLSAMDHHPFHIHGTRFVVTGTDGGLLAPSAQWFETSALIPVGTTRDLEFVADAPGDWPLHCHMTHHIMNQMGHGLPNLLGADLEKVNKRVEKLLPEYMSMGTSGMGEMGAMGMKTPQNSVPMVGAPGPYGYIDMGGMFTIVKIREGITSYEDPGWYTQPPGSGAVRVDPNEVSEIEKIFDRP